MPQGKPNPQTKATAKYQAKVGLMNKSFKLRKPLVDEFKATCEKTGESQASVISRYMKQYIEEHK